MSGLTFCKILMRWVFSSCLSVFSCFVVCCRAIFWYICAGLFCLIFIANPPRCFTWILAYSYVFWGAKRAEVRPDGRQLGIAREEGKVRLYLRGDGVHFNAVGIDLWSWGLQDGIERAVLVWRRAQV